jgi:hypothetical protein
VKIGEVAAASAGDEDLSAGLRIVFEQGYAAVSLSGEGGAHEARGPGAQNNCVEVAGGGHGLSQS